jgi:hypothetical protein
MTKMTTRADRVLPGDRIDGQKVVFAIPNVLRLGKTEVKFEDGRTEFLRNERIIIVERP